MKTDVVGVFPLFSLGLSFHFFFYRVLVFLDEWTRRIFGPTRCCGWHDKRRTTTNAAGTCGHMSVHVLGKRPRNSWHTPRSGTQYGGRRGVRRHKAPPLPLRRSVASRSPSVEHRFSSSSSRLLDRRRPFFRFILSPFPRWAEALRYGRKR